MKTLIFNNAAGIDVRYKTDLMGNNHGLFTVMTIEGLDTLAEEKLLQFQQLVYNFPDFQKFAEDNNLNFIVQEPNGAVKLYTEEIPVSIVVDENGLAFVDSVVLLSASSNAVELLGDAPFTVDGAATTEGDHVVLNWITATVLGNVLTVVGTPPSAATFLGSVKVQGNYGDAIWVDFSITATT